MSTDTQVPPAEQWEKIQQSITDIRQQTSRVIVGQDAIVEEMLVSLLCKGHCLLTGVPGLAKTLLVSTLGHILGLRFSRIQFTPDLMPTDIVGSEILQTDSSGGRDFKFVHGPIFANLLLADEINRTPPKTQAALLEAMQEKQVTVSGETRNLDEPFIVFATQNPIEQEGTYPLPEAQLDRFFFNLHIDYPTIDEEEQIIHRTTGRSSDKAEAILDAAGVLALQDATLDVPLPDNVVKYILKVTHRSRPNTDTASDFVNNYVDYGAGPRASQCMARACRALALLRGRNSASEEEVRDVALPILRHRVIPNYNATGEGISVNDIIGKLLED